MVSKIWLEDSLMGLLLDNNVFIFIDDFEGCLGVKQGVLLRLITL